MAVDSGEGEKWWPVWRGLDVAGEFSLVGVLYVFVGWDKKVWSV